MNSKKNSSPTIFWCQCFKCKLERCPNHPVHTENLGKPQILIYKGEKLENWK